MSWFEEVINDEIRYQENTSLCTARFSDMCGAEIPRWIRKRLESFGDDKKAIRAFGEDVVTELCHQLLEAGAPGLHFYTMNLAGPTQAIWKNLGLPTSE